MAKKKRRRTFILTKERAQIIAQAIVNNPDKMLKQHAAEFGCSYATVWKVLREYVNVNKTYSLRYPTPPDQK